MATTCSCAVLFSDTHSFWNSGDAMNFAAMSCTNVEAAVAMGAARNFALSGNASLARSSRSVTSSTVAVMRSASAAWIWGFAARGVIVST